MKPLYRRQLEEQRQLLQEVKQQGTTIRFDQRWVAASNIASQYYCEQKVDLQLQLGEIETEMKQLGSQAHEALVSEAVETSREELFQQIHSEQLTIAQEMLLLARYKDLILVGQPDAVAFRHGQALLLFEFKFSRSQIPYDSYHVQAEVYGKILENVGFDVRNLFYVIVIVPRASQKDGKVFQDVVDAVLKNGIKETHLVVNEANVYVHPYRPNKAEGNIDWALLYWRQTREAIPTQNPNKCKSCEYNASCTMKLDPSPIP